MGLTIAASFLTPAYQLQLKISEITAFPEEVSVLIDFF